MASGVVLPSVGAVHLEHKSEGEKREMYLRGCERVREEKEEALGVGSANEDCREEMFGECVDVTREEGGRERERVGNKEWRREREREREKERERERDGEKEKAGRESESEKEKRGVREMERKPDISDIEWLWVWVVTKLWFWIDLEYVEFVEVMLSDSVPSISVLQWVCENKLVVRRAFLDRSWLDWALSGGDSGEETSSEAALKMSVRRATHILRDVLSSRGRLVKVVWWTKLGEEPGSDGPPVLETLPTEAECQAWLAEHMGMYALEPKWGLCPPSIFRERCESGEVVFTEPNKLEMCSLEDERRLFFENEFVSPFNVQNMRRLSLGLRDQALVEKVLDRLEGGHDPFFRATGADSMALDWSAGDIHDEEDLIFIKETMMKYKECGFVAGPFKGRPPFPNSKNESQPVTNRCFTVPKDSTEPVSPGMRRRLIVHASFPEFLSYNFHLPRLHSGKPSHTHLKFLEKVARGGRNAIMMMMDMQHCYMQFKLKESEWHRQCVRIRDEFFVLRCGMFGSRSAGDFAENLVSVVTSIFHEVFHMSGVDCYVDNFENIVMPLPNGEPDWDKANREWKTMLNVAGKLGIPVHDFVAPTTIVGGVNHEGMEIDGHLGWGCSTFPVLKVWVTRKRRDKLGRALEKWKNLTKFSCRDIASILGVFQSFDGVLGCLGPFLKHLYGWKSECSRVVRLSSTLSEKSRFFSNKRLIPTLLGVVRFLEERDWTVPLVDWSTIKQQPEMVVYADAAAPKKLGTAYTGGVFGSGSVALFCTGEDNPPKVRGGFYAQPHSQQMIEMAMRDKALSSPLLELENYVVATVHWVQQTGCKNVVLVGDCKTAIDDWLMKVMPKDEAALKLLKWFWDKQLELGFCFRTERLPNTHPLIIVVDKLSKNNSDTITQLKNMGFEEARFERPQGWLDG